MLTESTFQSQSSLMMEHQVYSDKLIQKLLYKSSYTIDNWNTSISYLSIDTKALIQFYSRSIGVQLHKYNLGMVVLTPSQINLTWKLILRHSFDFVLQQEVVTFLKANYKFRELWIY